MSSGTEYLAGSAMAVEGDERDILQALADERANLLRAAVDARSAQEFSDLLGVSVGTCNRRIEELTGMGLLKPLDEEFKAEQTSETVYRRTVTSVTVAFEGAELDVTVEERNPVKNKLDDVWETLSDG